MVDIFPIMQEFEKDIIFWISSELVGSYMEFLKERLFR